MHNSPASTVDVDLDGVAGEVFEKAGVVALIRRRVVERGIWEGEHGRDPSCGSGGGSRGGDLENEYNRQQEHCDFPEGLRGSLCGQTLSCLDLAPVRQERYYPPRRIWPPILHPRSTARSDPAL